MGGKSSGIYWQSRTTKHAQKVVLVVGGGGFSRRITSGWLPLFGGSTFRVAYVCVAGRLRPCVTRSLLSEAHSRTHRCSCSVVSPV